MARWEVSRLRSVSLCFAIDVNDGKLWDSVSDAPDLPNAKLYRPGPNETLVPYDPGDRYEFQTTELGERLLATTSGDRIEFFKSVLNLYPGPFFITVVVQETYGAFEKAGRYYSEKGKTRVQIDYFLDYFHDFISYDGFHHLWVSCESTDGIVVYDQHDIFFIYAKAREAQKLLIEQGFAKGEVATDFHHAHRSRPEIVPGTEELLKYGKWWLAPLEIQDVALPENRTFKNMFLRFRNRRALKKIKNKKRGRLG